MRTTLDLPVDLIAEAMRISGSSNKTETIKLALKNLVDQDKRNKLLNYHGKLDLDLDLNVLRGRGHE